MGYEGVAECKAVIEMSGAAARTIGFVPGQRIDAIVKVVQAVEALTSRALEPQIPGDRTRRHSCRKLAIAFAIRTEPKLVLKLSVLVTILLS